jgi:hypothetical protein
MCRELGEREMIFCVHQWGECHIQYCIGLYEVMTTVASFKNPQCTLVQYMPYVQRYICTYVLAKLDASKVMHSISRGLPRIELGTSPTLRVNHATRPKPLTEDAATH